MWRLCYGKSIVFPESLDGGKYVKKSTYPPPADGARILFLCNPRCSANESAAQAGRDALQATGSFTDCKDLKRSAAGTHSDVAGDHEQRRVGGPGFIG